MYDGFVMFRAASSTLVVLLLMGAACTPRGSKTTASATASASATGSASATAMTSYADVPGVVIAHSPAASKAFIGSPSIAILPNGTFVASHDLFGPGTGWRTTRVFASTDRGRTWTERATIDGQFWSTLFVHGDALYLFGTSGQYGDVAIRRSQDGGKTWTTPRDASSGVLRTGGKFHCAPVPVIDHAGRVWRAMEQQTDPIRWPQNFRAFMMSAPSGADLLDAKSWTSSDLRPGDESWLDGEFNGWLEGNAVAAPDGQVVDVLRVDKNGPETAAIVRVGDDGKTSSFDPKAGFAPFPGGAKKFTIRFDPATKLYWSISNYVPPELSRSTPSATRNTLALIASPDLESWSVRAIVLHHPDRHKHAFQYVDWQLDGDDLVAVSRTSFDDGEGGADTYHNANFLTFHRIAKFRTLAMKDSVPVAAAAPVKIENADFALEGSGIEIATLDPQNEAFSNRDYAWEGIPAQFLGWRYTRTAGGERARITVTAKRRATIYMLTAPSQRGAALAGWEAIPSPGFGYDDRKHTAVGVYRRDLDAGQKLDVEQGNWSGSMILFK